MSSEAVAAAAYLILANGNKRRKRKKPRWWIRDLFVKSSDNRKEFFEKLISSSLFKNFTRMSRQDFDYLVEKVTPWVKKADTNCRDAIPVQVRVLLTLRYLATGDSCASLMYLFSISIPSICRIIPGVCSAFINVLRDFVKVSS